MATSSTEKAMHVRTASGINTVLGIWMLISPWIYSYASVNSAAAWDSGIVGVLIALFGLTRYNSPHRYPALSWINLALGAWTAVSPWIYEIGGNGVWNSVLVGLAIAILAIWSGSATAAERRHVHA